MIKKKTKTIIVGYGRVSSDEQATSGLSLLNQRQQCQKYADEKGYELVYFEDAGKSGANLNRDGFKAMVKYINEHKVKCILLWKLDRITRNIEDYYGVISPLLRKSDTTIASIVERFDDVFDIEPMILAVYLGISAQELKNTKVRTNAVLKHRVENGYLIGKAPIGYLNARDKNKHGIVIPDPDKAHYIKRLFELYATGMFSFEKAGKELAKYGFVNSLGKPYPKKRIGDILNSPVYMGKILHHGEIYDGNHEPIVTPELFYRVQMMLDEDRKQKGHNEIFTYSNYIACEICNYRMIGHLRHGAHNSGNYIYYRCSNFTKVHKTEKNIRQELIDEAMQEVIDSFDISEKELKNIRKQIFNTMDELQLYERKSIDELNKQYKNVADAIILTMKEKELNPISRKETLNSLQAEKDEISRKITCLSQTSKEAITRMSILLDYANRLPELYLKATSQEKRLILVTITDRITINAYTGVLTVKLKPIFEHLRQLKLQNKVFKTDIDNLNGTLEIRSESAKSALKKENRNLDNNKGTGTRTSKLQTVIEGNFGGKEKINVDDGT